MSINPEPAPRRGNPIAEFFGFSSASSLKPPSPYAMEKIQRPRPMTSLLASATRITNRTVKSSAFRKATHADWQDDAWAMYDLVGEQRFLATTIAARVAKGRLYVGKLGAPEDDPAPIEDERVKGILEAIGDGPQGMARLVERLATNLFITGDGWLVGIPKDLMPSIDGGENDDAADDLRRGLIDRSAPDENLQEDRLDDHVWRMLSVSELVFNQQKVILTLGPTEEERLEVHPDDVYLIRVWRPHPRFWWEADSPTRSSLPVLRELVGLTMHISAQIDSRLAGAGVFIVPQSASNAVKRAAGIPDDDPQDPFTDALMQSMLTPIGDRANASALVPLVLTVPDESTDKFQHITFDKPLDSEARSMRDEAIRRLALGQDAPPELLLGTAGMNHWGGWLVREDVVASHIEPILALICDALTTQYLRPVLIENGFTEEEAEELVVWYDVSHMIMRPNRAADAKDLYREGVIGDKALRHANGFDESDAPDEETDDPAIVAAFEMVKANPGLMRRPGLDVIVGQLRALLDGNPLGAIDGASKAVASDTVATEGSSAEEDTEQPAAAGTATPVGTPTEAGGPPARGIPSTTPGDLATSGPNMPLFPTTMRVTPVDGQIQGSLSQALAEQGSVATAEKIEAAFRAEPGGAEFIEGYIEQQHDALDATRGIDDLEGI